MSEKRIEFMGYDWEEIGGKWLVKIDDLFYEIDWNYSESLVNKLNEQQAIINKLKKENERLQQERIKDAKEFSALFKQNLDFHSKNKKLQQEKDYWKNKFNEGTETFESNLAEENEKLKEENEQLQQFINNGKRLSVKELIDNVNENLVLKKKIRGLEKDNERLKEELNNFKPVMFQDMRKGTVILYSKGDIDE